MKYQIGGRKRLPGIKYKRQAPSRETVEYQNPEPNMEARYITKKCLRKEFIMSPEIITGIAGLLIVFAGATLTAFITSKR